MGFWTTFFGSNTVLNIGQDRGNPTGTINIKPAGKGKVAVELSVQKVNSEGVHIATPVRIVENVSLGEVPKIIDTAQRAGGVGKERR